LVRETLNTTTTHNSASFSPSGNYAGSILTRSVTAKRPLAGDTRRAESAKTTRTYRRTGLNHHSGREARRGLTGQGYRSPSSPQGAGTQCQGGLADRRHHVC
jgi:hypothetical protein